MSIEEFDALAEAEAAAALRACVDIDSWVAALLAGRPYGDADALRAAARGESRTWSAAEVDDALAGHPRIGERADRGQAGAAHSAREQAGLDPADADLAARLRAGNERYEERFGRIYLVRAKGRSGPELLRLLEERLSHDPATEQRVTHEQLAEIALLRLEDLLTAPAPDPATAPQEPR
ncbi:2-oxo-4-hydroxy-4-carboxy-5-ureidoimidazoline decarboxylase [Nocardioides sambongensis]|uniref:2-oxo-4-hydroxy-4-carboxy-5-ureidoimidazoline decarboxylase n=1 Tax=Nocardioides sambongensis TaxID=2589074 RepID=UPI00112A87CE|nr:2-oxo-4-hydroxy-4-carboxy-5-ureidoimidazoline decarboxylase [Nocardioides sambongensis]